jgi:hypothetical protein
LSFSGEDICGMYLSLSESSCLLIPGIKALKCTAQYYPEKSHNNAIAIGENVQLILSTIDSIILKQSRDYFGIELNITNFEITVDKILKRYAQI